MLKKIIDKAKLLGFTDVEVIESASDEITISLFNGEVDKNFIGMDKSYIIKGLIDNKMAIVQFQKNDEDLSDKEIETLLLKLKDNVESITSPQENSIFAGSKSYPKIKKVDGKISTTSIDEKIAMLKEVEKIGFAYDSRIELAPYCQYVEERTSRRIVNSKGLDISKSNEYCGIVYEALAGNSKEDPNKQVGFEVKIDKDITKINPSEIAKVACEKALSMLGAGAIPSKVYPVIIENDAMGDLLSGFFSMFSGESAIRKMTSLTDKVGQKIMDEKITIVDDPLKEDAILQDPFDAEGVATYKKAVVEKGVFKMFLQNLKTAKFFNTESTGNASMNGVTAMNFYVEPGTKSKEEMIASIKEGLLVTDLDGLHAGLNPISGDFSAQTKGYLIEDGKITKPITLVVVSGNFLKMMNDVEVVGSDLKLKHSGFGAPSVLFKGLSVSGQ